MKKSIRLIAAALAAVSAMSCAAVPAFADKTGYFTYVDSIAGIQFDNVDDLIAFIAENNGKSAIEKIEPKASDWLLTTESLSIPSIAAENLSDIVHIIITPTYVSTMFKAGGKTYELYAYIDKKVGMNKYEVAKGEVSNGAYDSRKMSSGGNTVYFSRILDDGNYTWKEGSRYYWLRVYDSTGYSEEDLKYCTVTEYPLTGTEEAAAAETGWKTIDGIQYYFDENGKKTTKPATIDGVLYKFGKDGVCLGRYTGWAVAGNGRYYYKDGVKIKNRWLRVGGKKVYYLLKSGKAATGTVTIGGREYTFDKKGRLVS